MSRTRSLWLCLSGTLLFSSPALACAVCYGDKGSDQVLGAKAGVLLLLGVIVSLLATIAGVALFWASRARKLDELEALQRAAAIH